MNNDRIQMRWSRQKQHTLELELKRKGADIIRFADLSGLSAKITRGVRVRFRFSYYVLEEQR